jgi:tripartite-type tricarboxylate transporter receptor subunit TctC
MDIFARLVAEIAPRHIDQRFIIVNKPGAGGAIAATDVANAKPDGYKLVTMSTSYYTSVFKTQKLMFNPDHVTPLWTFMMFRTAMFIRNDAPWKSLGDLLADAKKNPGKLTWGHPGRGLSAQIAASLILKKAGVNMTEIPHKGSAELLAALLGGHVDVITTSFGTVSPHVASGKVRCVAVYSHRRFSNQPDIPTANEQGFPDVDKVSAYVGLYGHRDIPERPRRILAEAFKKTCEDPALRAGVEKMGEEPLCETPEFSLDTIRKGNEIVSPLLKELGIYVEQK